MKTGSDYSLAGNNHDLRYINSNKCETLSLVFYGTLQNHFNSYDNMIPRWSAMHFYWRYTPRLNKKTNHFYILNNSVKHWPILIFFGMLHHEKTWHKRLQFSLSHLNTVAPATLLNSEVVVWPFTTMYH